MQFSRLFSSIIILAILTSVNAFSEYSVVRTKANSTAITLQLSYTGKNTYYIKPTSPIIRNLLFTFRSLTYSDFQFKITDPNNQRFQIPTSSPFPIDPQGTFSFPLSLASFDITYTETPFDFKITRKSNGNVLFSTYESLLIFSDYYIEVGTQLASQNLFGLGQRLSPGFKVKNGRWTMFNRDRGDYIDTGIGLQTYGHFPFYLIKESDNNFHIAYHRTSSALDAIKEQRNQKNYLTWKLIGGVIDFRFFLGDSSPQTSLERLHSYYGGSTMPPFWAMGYHQSRWGYKDIAYLKKVIQNFEKNDLPLDTLWSDLDYMIENQVFTIDQTRFPPDEMKEILKKYRWMPIIDPGIKNTGPIYQAGLAKNAYILDANTNQPFVGRMRVGRTVYPDFFHPNASIYWTQMLQALYQKVPYSGLWLDSDEFTSFCLGRCEPPSTPSKFDYGVDLPYSPGADELEGDTISLNSTHYGNLIEADVHIFNGFLETKVSYDFLKSKNIQPFILTRSSVLGSSKWSIHWSGDNVATFQFLRTSIPDNFNSQLFGFQVTGADICGFDESTNPQLCARWYQLGSLYPFCRNHNHRSAVDQEPYALGQPTLTAAKINLKLRYSLLKHLYSNLAMKKGRGAHWRPLFFSFPNDSSLYLDEIMDTQLLIGQQMLIAPILQANKSTRNVYFPQTNWYNFYSGDIYLKGSNVTIQNQPNELVPIFLRQQFGLLIQDSTSVTQTKQLDNKFILVAALQKEQVSNETDQMYTANAYTLSIADYESRDKQRFIAQGCIYRFAIRLEVGTDYRNLKLDIKVSQTCPADELIISQVRLFTCDLKIGKTLSQQVRIKGAGNITIEIGQKSNLVEVV